MRKPWVIAHRGASGHAPENTMAAFERAVALGAGFIETDLHLTRDARFVAIHDPTLERTTNGKGLVKDFTLAEIRRLDAGLWFDREFMGGRATQHYYFVQRIGLDRAAASRPFGDDGFAFRRAESGLCENRHRIGGAATLPASFAGDAGIGGAGPRAGSAGGYLDGR